MSQVPVTDVKMLANATFNEVISQIQDSCLNYTMQITPYSAMISIRKSFLTDRSGSTVMPFKAQESVVTVEKKYLETVDDLKRAREKIQCLERTIVDRDETIAVLNTDLKNERKTTVNLNKELCNTNMKLKNERNATYNDLEADIEIWKKELSDMNIKHNILQNKFESLTAGTGISSFDRNADNTKGILSSIKPEIPYDGSLEEFNTICTKLSFPNQEYFRGEEKPFCDMDCKFPKMDPFSIYVGSHIPNSLVSHWTVPPDTLKLDVSQSFSLRSHYVTQQQPVNTHVMLKEVKVAPRTLFERYDQEYEETCKQS